jgi:uncharacterized Ntn-hydrolase superfamily protein
MRVLIFTLTSLAVLACGAAQARVPLPPAHTYSIVAYDAATNQMGVAVQSHYFAVGPIVPWAEPGVGVVATQSLVEVSYGPLGIELMRSGKTSRQALTALLAADENPEVRQVAMIDAQGAVAVHTGDKCIPEAGHISGERFSCQANLMLRDTVPDAMARAFERAEGDLAHRMLAALFAAEAEGGDIRGKQSAALVVVAIEPGGNRWEDYICDIRVDDAPEPLPELKRLLDITDSYRALNDAAAFAEQGDLDAAEAEYARMRALQPANAELAFWYATVLLELSRIDEAEVAAAAEGEDEVPSYPPELRERMLKLALAHFAECFAQAPIWREIIPRLQAVGRFTEDEKLVRRILSM